MAISGESASELARGLAPCAEELRGMLRDLRERANLSRAYLAALLGVPKETLRRWEDGSRSPSGAARRLIWLMRCALFEPDRITNTEQIITWGR
jgi:DNA-binding transcriptional regulator YiaG